ncbi:MAG: helix-turn-helix domain-containing protein [Sphingomonas sp.]|nr:helix-turn-helix domain-containing protein [Sphingomonas sp.]MDX3884348.1 helix-turn-helix domain-containing protein [Sphingomonas sp.]
MAIATTVDLILDAGLAVLAEAGPEGASVRGIADRAGVPAATLQHHFVSKQALLKAIYARAADRHVAATATALSAFAGLAALPVPDTELVIALLRTWLGEAERATAGILHLLAQAARDGTYAPMARDWEARMVAAMAGEAGLPADVAGFVLELIVGVALASAPHAFRVEKDVLDRELLLFVFGRRDADAGGWLRAFRDREKRRDPGDADRAASGDVARAVLDAGIRMMAESGGDALSYRKVAARAAVAPSSVLYNFPTRQHLVMAIYEDIHRRFTRSVPAGRLERAGLVDRVVAMFPPMITRQMAGEVPLVLASCELFLAGWRDPELARQAWSMRLARGQVRDDAGATPNEDLLSHFLSLWTIGLGMLHLSRDPAEREGHIVARMRAGAVLARLG